MKKQRVNKTKKEFVNKRGGKRSPIARSARRKNNNFALDAKQTLVGLVQGSGKGFAFFIPSDESGDLFIAAKNLNGAMHGDTVEAVKISSRRGNGEAEVVRIIKRGFTDVVGVFDGRYVVASERGFGQIKADKHGSLNAEAGDKVVAKLIKGTDPLKCRITEILGKEGDIYADIMGVIRANKLYETFPPAVIRETAAMPDEVRPEDVKNRRDFRGDDTVTIDGATSKDFDDAICVEKNKKGYRLYVHIADVAQYVTENTKTDAEAFKRGTSVYFADRVLPMLPEKLSNGICSLNEGADRLTLSCIMDFDEDGNVLSHEITEGVIRSKARMTYESVQKILDGDETEREKYARLLPMLDSAAELAKKLNALRMQRGSVEFDIEECEIIMGENGTVKDVRKRARLFSHKLIEEFMLIANETVAQHFSKRNLPFVYRVHEVPPEEKVENLNAFLDGFGLSVPNKPKPDDYAKLIGNLEDPIKGIVNRVALRSMSKAEYKPACLGHFGLAAQYYCHFTSPIRRYPDLAIHRIIKYVLHGGADPDKKFGKFAEEASVQSSEREKIADEAERSVDDLLKAKFMTDKVGSVYDAVIDGVTEWGLFAELDNGIEGMIRVENLPGGGYVFDEKRLLVSNVSHRFRIGDKIRIRVESVSFDKIAFALVED